MEEIIYFNVGGKIFATYKSTINTFPNSLLSRMILKENEMVTYDKNGYIFIDRNPELFSVILDIYRNNGNIFIPYNISEEEIEIEKDYFLINDEYNNVENRNITEEIIDIIKDKYPNFENQIMNLEKEKNVKNEIKNIILEYIDFFLYIIIDMNVTNKETFIICIKNNDFKRIENSNNEIINIEYTDFFKWKNILDFTRLLKLLNTGETDIFNYYIKVILNMYVILEKEEKNISKIILIPLY